VSIFIVVGILLSFFLGRILSWGAHSGLLSRWCFRRGFQELLHLVVKDVVLSFLFLLFFNSSPLLSWLSNGH